MNKKSPLQDGVQALAEMFNVMDKESRDRILNNVAQADPEVARQIAARMFTFEHMHLLDGQKVQSFLRQIPSKKLAKALRGASSDMLAFVKSNMSKAAVQNLQEEIDAMGPQRRVEVEDVQKEIVEQLKLWIGSKT